VTSYSAYGVRGRKRKEGRVWSDGVLSSQETIMCDGALLFRRWVNTCLPMGSSEWICCFALLVCTAFALPIKPLPQLTSSLCHPSESLPHPTVEE